MGAPSTLTLIAVTIKMERFAGWTPSIGQVRIYTDNVLQSPTEDLFVTDVDETKLFDTSGVCDFLLPASNDPQWSPPEITYNCDINTGGRTISGKFFLPYDGGPVNLADVLNVASPAPGQVYVLQSSRGASGGVATLGSDGFIPDAQFRYPILVLEDGDPVPPDTRPDTLIFHKTA